MALQSGEAMTIPAIKVVIVTYNSADTIVACMEGLAHAAETYTLEVAVVDNGSSDGTKDLLRGRYPGVQVVASRNSGYAHGCNLGVRDALDSGREYAGILILNPDVELGHGTVDRLAEVLGSSVQVGGVSPHIVEHSGDETVRLRTLFGGAMRREPLAGRDVTISDRLHGCCMLLRPDVFRTAGFMDEDYFLYWEELDFGFKVLAAGYKLLLCYDVLVEHRLDAEERPHRAFYMWRNQIRFAKRNFPLTVLWIFLLRRMLASARELAGFVLTQRFDLVRAALAGLLAGLRGETGMSVHPYAMPAVSRAADGRRT